MSNEIICLTWVQQAYLIASIMPNLHPHTHIYQQILSPGNQFYFEWEWRVLDRVTEGSVKEEEKKVLNLP